MSRTAITVCTVQPSITWNQPPRTFETVAALVEQATDQVEVDIVVLPEHVNAVEEADGETRHFDDARDFFARLARAQGINLVAGSIERYDRKRQARFNTSMVFDRGGTEVGRYDKRRLFGYEKRRHVQPGTAPLVVDLDGVRCGVLICSDLWHPELVRELASEIEVLCVPAQTAIRPESTPAYARLIWHSLAMTRAQENVIALAVSDSAVESSAPYRCGGVSSITDPSAEPDLAGMQQVLSEGSQGYLAARIDLQRLEAFRGYRLDNGLLPGQLLGA